MREATRTECWERLDEEEKVRLLLGRDMDEEQTIDRYERKDILKLMDKKRWMDLGNGSQ